MIKENYDKFSEQRRSKFLDRFQGRTSTIGKAGLLSLLQQNLPQSKNNHEDVARYLQSGLIEPRDKNPQITGRFRYNQIDQEDKRSSNHSFKTQLPRRNSLQMGSLGNMGATNSSSIPKLPKINKAGLGFNMKSSLQLKPDRRNPYEAAKKDTAQHLEFLNLFQERLKKINKK